MKGQVRRYTPNTKNGINIHSQCNIKIEQEINKYIKLENRHKELESIMYKQQDIIRSQKIEIDTLFENNKELKIQVDELLDWKNGHICKCDCDDNVNIEEIKESIIKEINVNEIPEYIKIKNINEGYNNKILQLNKDIEKLQLNSDIKDNILFKQLKEQNTLLFENNKKLDLENNVIKQRLDIVEKNNNIFDVIEKDNSVNETNINIDLKINEALEKQKDELNNKYFNKIDSLTKIIENLQIQINNKKTKVENKSIDKYSENNLYNSIYIYKDIKLPYQEYRASKTYRKILEEIEFNDKICDDIKYDDITKWINENEKSNFKSTYFKNKYERCKYLLNKYKDNLIILKKIKFSLSYIANMSDPKFTDWLNILNNKINNEDSSDSDNSDDSIKTMKDESVKNCKYNSCNNYNNCKCKIKKCDNCDDKFITDNKYIIECGDC